MCKKMTDFALQKCGGIRVDACRDFAGDWQFHKAEPKAREPMPVPSDCKKCRLVAKLASFSIASLTNLFILPTSGDGQTNSFYKKCTLSI